MFLSLAINLYIIYIYIYLSIYLSIYLPIHRHRHIYIYIKYIFKCLTRSRLLLLVNNLQRLHYRFDFVEKLLNGFYIKYLQVLSNIFTIFGNSLAEFWHTNMWSQHEFAVYCFQTFCEATVYKTFFSMSQPIRAYEILVECW